MGFLRPKIPPPPPPPAPPPVLPPPTVEQMEQAQLNEIRDLTYKKKKGYTDTILTGNEGDESEADVHTNVLLGE